MTQRNSLNKKFVVSGLESPSHDGKTNLEDSSPPTGEAILDRKEVTKISRAPGQAYCFLDTASRELGCNTGEENVCCILVHTTHMYTTHPLGHAVYGPRS